MLCLSAGKNGQVFSETWMQLMCSDSISHRWSVHFVSKSFLTPGGVGFVRLL